MGLPWVRLDTSIPTNDKIIELSGRGDRGLAAAFVYVSSLAHAAGQETSGIVKRGALPFLHGKPGHAKLLVEVGLWAELPDGKGWSIVNYGSRNLVGMAAQEAENERSRKARDAANARWHGGATG